MCLTGVGKSITTCIASTFEVSVLSTSVHVPSPTGASDTLVTVGHTGGGGSGNPVTVHGH